MFVLCNKRNKQAVFKIPITLAIFALLSAARASAAQAAVEDPGPVPILFGYVYFVSLAAFAPNSASIPLHVLRSRQFDAAYAPLLEQFDEHPGSLAIIAGVMQASIGEPSPNFLDESLKELGSLDERKLSAPDRFRLATALDYSFSCGWTHPDATLLRRSQRILNELWQKYHDPMEGLMLAESGYGAGLMNDPNTPIDVTKIQEQIICSLLTPAGAKQFTTASQDGWQGPPPDIDQAPIDNRARLMCVVQSLYSVNANNFRIGKVQNGKVVWTTVPFTPEEQQIQDYLKPWLIALGSATGLKYVLAS